MPIILLIAIHSYVVSHQQQGSSTLQSLVQAERAFAATSVRIGSRAAFLEFFADDGIVFRPDPLPYKEAVKNTPPPANPLASTLNWEPIYADVSWAGDLGYTTGPFTLTDNTSENRPVRHGYFFSIWKRQADRSWKVALDLGIRVEQPYTGEGGLKTGRPVKRDVQGSNISREEGRASLLAVERQLLSLTKRNGHARALLESMDVQGRLYRQGFEPFVGRDSISAYLRQNPTTQSWEPMKADVARSFDLGYTYGRYEMSSHNSPSVVSEKGYFVRVWKRNEDGKWKVVFDITSPLPPEAPKAKQ